MVIVGGCKVYKKTFKNCRFVLAEKLKQILVVMYGGDGDRSQLYIKYD